MISICPVCLSNTILKQPVFNWQFWNQTYSLSKCTHCGCSFTIPHPDDLTLEKLYRIVFDYRWYQDHLSAKIRDSNIRLNEYKTLLGKRVLDFGGGLGYFSQVARAQGYESITYDPFINKTSPPPEEAWDTLVALHVLEHANNLDRTCKQIKNLLAPGGRIIIAVPNYSGMGYQSLEMKWVWAQPPLIHIFHFTAAGLEALLRRHGFTNIEISYHERWDANNVSDIEHCSSTRRWDRAWGIRPLNTIPFYRKLIAMHNSRRRFRDLKSALINYDKTYNLYSELQITAVLEKIS
jgi:hypothetical protein